MNNKAVWIIVVVLVLLGLYYWSLPVADEVPAAPETSPAAAAADAVPAAPITEVPAAPAEAVAPAK